MLQVRNLSKRYGTRQVVNNVSFNMERGEIVSVVGASGAGKTTLLHLIGGIEKPNTGSVFLEQTEMTMLTISKLAKVRNVQMGFIFQFHYLLPEFTALENVRMPKLIAGRPMKEANQASMEMLKIVGLYEKLYHLPHMLSGGEQQRVAVARALVNRPHLILADEPTGNLDSANAQHIHQLFCKLCATLKQSFLIITHNEALAKQAHRTITMQDGAIVSDVKNEGFDCFDYLH